ncbi:MAG: ABC transporter substrate-binding protein [Bacillus thermozeamaize]|uniref:ABC transporter substrate-binding protein n=1 Tax=Bacillus thermozeamaize TaxID=230954 RepID=A0A1Y3PP10_9BACI|nr:MAG: ABC transporter substrate-binding protein [Bacillus thermozeamaize]
MRRKGGLVLGTLLILAAVLLAACSPKTAVPDQQESGSASDAAAKGEAVLKLSWEEIEAAAKGSQVNLFMWGGDDGINRYIDEWVAPRVKEQYGITLKRYPMDASEFINKLLSEKQSRKQAGSMDIIWINGENFRNAKENGLLLGPIAPLLPNVQRYMDPERHDLKYDFGYPTEGYEVPWGRVQFVFAYDSAKVSNPPRTLEQLVEWVKKHPGKFTYPAPPDFTGSAFIRHVLFETAGGVEPFLKPFDEQTMESYGQAVWDVLNEMAPYLWRQGKSYPQSLAQLDQLYQNGEVWMTMGYDEARPSLRIAEGQFPPTTRTFVLEGGTLANSHYLAVPFNAPNPHGALTVINFLLSPEAQKKKMEQTYWGENMSLDLERLSPADQEWVRRLDRGVATLPEDVLAKHRLPEIDGRYVEWLERKWLEKVGK